MNEQFVVPSLGACRIQSPLPLSTSSEEDNFRFVEDSQRILYQATFNDLNQHELCGGESPVSFEAAGPISPNPSTAVPFEITATKLPFAVYL